jgi:hypothetical protein
MAIFVPVVHAFRQVGTPQAIRSAMLKSSENFGPLAVTLRELEFPVTVPLAITSQKKLHGKP